ncbi:hypothetical protein [Streptosporangium sp. NPDC049046]|uniref:hypothetical protein n=1 Tax=unclassified Streptosporangium TaxID=2632669 RepID=UPI0034431AD7
MSVIRVKQTLANGQHLRPDANITYATSGRVISGDRKSNTRLGLVRSMMFH